MINYSSEYMDAGQVTELLHIHPNTLHRYRKAGKIEGFKVGRAYLYKTSDVNKLVEELGGTPTASLEKAQPEGNIANSRLTIVDLEGNTRIFSLSATETKKALEAIGKAL